jgi:hypothetical protein
MKIYFLNNQSLIKMIRLVFLCLVTFPFRVSPDTPSAPIPMRLRHAVFFSIRLYHSRRFRSVLLFFKLTDFWLFHDGRIEYLIEYRRGFRFGRAGAAFNFPQATIWFERPMLGKQSFLRQRPQPIHPLWAFVKPNQFIIEPRVIGAFQFKDKSDAILFR